MVHIHSEFAGAASIAAATELPDPGEGIRAWIGRVVDLILDRTSAPEPVASTVGLAAAVDRPLSAGSSHARLSVLLSLVRR